MFSSCDELPVSKDFFRFIKDRAQFKKIMNTMFGVGGIMVARETITALPEKNP